MEQLVRTHLNLVRRLQKFLPVTDVAIEVNRFAFLLLDDPSATGLDFQNGPLKGYADVEAAVHDQQDGQCLLCGKAPIQAYHHIVPRHCGGSEGLYNRAGLCGACHELVHCRHSTRQSHISASDWKKLMAKTMYIIAPGGKRTWYETPWVSRKRKRSRSMR